MACTVKVSNVSSKATIREIMEFFSNSGQIESINLNSDGDDDSQTAYVTFKDHDSLKIAVLLSGSTILDKEVEVSAFSKPGTEELAQESGNDSPEGGGSSPIRGRPGAINGVQDVVRSMLSRGLSVGKDVMRRANLADEKSKTAAVDGDPLRSMNESVGQTSGDVDEGSVSKGKTDRDVKHKVNEEGKAGGDVASQAFHESKLRSGNVRDSMQKCYKHVCAVNEKLQIGQRTMSALASAQQGVASAGSAVASNKLMAAGGGWVSSAFSRVPLINKNSTASHVGEGTSLQQLTEMTSFPTHKSEQ